MRTGHSTIRTGFIALVFACALSAWAQEDAAFATVDARAPIAAVLLPTVQVHANVDGSEASLRVADTQPLPVTLLPTVHVYASVGAPAYAMNDRGETAAPVRPRIARGALIRLSM